MKFEYRTACECGGEMVFLTTGEEKFEPGKCSSCGRTGNLLDPLSVSVTAERLLHRSKTELGNGDFSLSIIFATIAVESYLTRLFLKFKGMESYASTFKPPSKSMEDSWEKEYPRKGGFIPPADFVAKRLTGGTFDQFVNSNNVVAAQAFLGLPNANNVSPSRFFQDELFKRRNRIVHWGFVNSTLWEAEECHRIAIVIVTILREMDRVKYRVGPEVEVHVPV